MSVTKFLRDYKDSDTEGEGNSKMSISKKTSPLRKTDKISKQTSLRLNSKKTYESDRDSGNDSSLNRTMSSDGGYFNADSDEDSDLETELKTTKKCSVASCCAYLFPKAAR